MEAYYDAFAKIANNTAEPSRRRREAGMNDLHVWRCIYLENKNYYKPVSEISKPDTKTKHGNHAQSVSPTRIRMICSGNTMLI